MSALRNYLNKIKPNFQEGGKLHAFESVFDGFESFLYVPNTTAKSGASIHDSIDSKRIMSFVVIALIPALLFGMYNVGYQNFKAAGTLDAASFIEVFGFGFLAVLPKLLVSYIVGLGIEFAWAQWKHEEIQEGYLVSGIIIPLIIPITTPLWMLALACAFAVIFCKEIFGGTGMNIFNVAVGARMFLFFSYPLAMSGDKVWVAKDAIFGLGNTLPDGFTAATPLGQLAQGGMPTANLCDAITGFIPGCIGETSVIAIAIGAIILLTIVLYRFTNRLGKNIAKLRIFAYKADHNESLEIEDLASFPNDELGEIAERIIKMYKRIQTTRREQDILKRQLTQNIAHELKTPVASIQGYLETILDNPHINEEMKSQFLQRCYAQSERLTSLLRDISTLNRLDDGSDMIDFEAVDITQLVSDIMRETALEREERKMSFHNLLPEHIVVKGNRSLLYSIFRNLADNAIAYAGQGKHITLTAQEKDGTWHFTFTDDGVGVAPEHLARLFERFYRVDKGRSRKMGGTGLGLAIVKNAVLLHGGTIRVSNQLEGGLKFEFTLKK